MRKREQAIVSQGYEFYSFEYDGDAQHEQLLAEKRGLKCKLLREKTDTVGLKMYSVWVKH